MGHLSHGYVAPVMCPGFGAGGSTKRWGGPAHSPLLLWAPKMGEICHTMGTYHGTDFGRLWDTLWL